MVRVGGLTYSCDPAAPMGKRIDDLALNGKPLDAARRYKVAGWAPVSEDARSAGGEPIWEVAARYLRRQKLVRSRPPNVPLVKGVADNPGFA
jgi:sulfur-oxidizing protein SoxB